MDSASTDKEEPLNVLVVDDHPENVLALTEILSKENYRTLSAQSGPEALRQILKNEFAVVILDVVMPHMNGFDTARMIRQRSATKDLPIIFLTASGPDADLIKMGYSLGAADYLSKPVDPAIVRAKVGVFVELLRKAKQLKASEEQLRESERKQSSEALRASEAQYEAAFEAAPIGIAHAAVDGKLLRANQKFCAILDYSKSEVLGLRCQDVVFPDALPDLSSVLHLILMGETRSHRAETRYLRRDGTPVWVDVTISLVRDEQQRAKNLIFVIEDISDRRAGEERQRFLAAASASLISSMHTDESIDAVARMATGGLVDFCVIDVSVDGKHESHVAHVEPEKEKILATASVELLASPQASLPDVERAQLFFADGPARDETVPGMATFLEQLGARSVAMVPLSARGRGFGKIIVGTERKGRLLDERDLTTIEDLAHRIAFSVDNARLYRDAQEAIRVRDEFLSIASHELRTPLTPLQIQLQRLVSGKGAASLEELPKDRLKTVLQRSDRQVQRLIALVDNLLDVSQITAGPLQLHRETFDLADLTTDVTGRLKEEALRAGCALEVELPEGALVGSWDRLRIEQILTNLLVNAVKYGSGKPIYVSLAKKQTSAMLRVRDQGIGIAEDKLPRIFERFERAVPSESYGGLGLGLYIVRQLVNAHEGSIDVESRQGEGSTFSVALPTGQPDSRHPPRGANSEPQPKEIHGHR